MAPVFPLRNLEVVSMIEVQITAKSITFSLEMLVDDVTFVWREKFPKMCFQEVTYKMMVILWIFQI